MSSSSGPLSIFVDQISNDILLGPPESPHTPLIRATRPSFFRRIVDMDFDQTRYVIKPLHAFGGRYVVKRVAKAMQIVGNSVHGHKVGVVKVNGEKPIVTWDEKVDPVLGSFCLWVAQKLHQRRKWTIGGAIVKDK